MHLARWIAALVVMAQASAVRADDVTTAATNPIDGDELGHLPLLEAGLMGGFTTVPFARPDRTGCTVDCGDTVFGGLFGVEARLNLDLQKVLVLGSATWSAVGGAVGVGRAEIVFAAGLGGRTTVNMSKPIGGYSTATEDVTISKVYLRKKLPLVYGVELGTTAFQMNDTSDGGAPVAMKDATTLAAIDAGFALVSPQIRLLAAPAYELSTQTFGFRWAWQIAFPIGSYPLYFRMEGDHYFGDDSTRRLGTMLTFGLGVGSSLGVLAD